MTHSHPDCQITRPHAEHIFTVLGGPNSGATVDCAGIEAQS